VKDSLLVAYSCFLCIQLFSVVVQPLHTNLIAHCFVILQYLRLWAFI